ncbi:MAG TPA: type II toxin-antitoxin system VapC family toxin [Steroidobacteraceae bacterium]|nr:type II toxin-antitoxin system VapC family toxin [Steroidobacteraceae bacterium]
MAETNEAEASRGPPVDTGIYLDSSALAKLYLPEDESDRLDTLLQGRRGLTISHLAITEVLSAVAGRKREGLINAEQALQIRDALLADADSGVFELLNLDPTVHREAERLLLSTDSIPLRTLDALHVALALSGSTSHVITFDARMRTVALQVGLRVVEV